MELSTAPYVLFHIKLIRKIHLKPYGRNKNFCLKILYGLIGPRVRESRLNKQENKKLYEES